MDKKNYISIIKELTKENIPEAKKLADGALDKFPQDIELLFLLANIYEAQAENTKAINIYYEILDLDKENKEAKVRQEYLFTIQRYKNSDIFASTNLGHDPWLEE